MSRLILDKPLVAVAGAVDLTHNFSLWMHEGYDRLSVDDPNVYFRVMKNWPDRVLNHPFYEPPYGRWPLYGRKERKPLFRAFLGFSVAEILSVIPVHSTSG